jgi:cytochrome c-type biogenesis protein CcmF
MPWLVGTALIHSLAVTEKRGVFKSWTVLLAMIAFSLSLLGTFLVRSGVLTSVHAFATDPKRGVFILAFLTVVIGGSLALYAWRAPTLGLGKVPRDFTPTSRESLLLANNVLLVVAMAAVVLGTLYPLFLDALKLGKISVGPPYFDSVFYPLMAPALFLMAVGPISRWRNATLPDLVSRLKWAFGVSVASAIVIPLLMGKWTPLVALGLLLATWIIAASVTAIAHRFQATPGTGLIAKISANRTSYYGMHLAHIGIAAFVIGVTMVKGFEIERDVRMAPGQTVTEGGYEFKFIKIGDIPGPNYSAIEAQFEVRKNGSVVTTLTPEKRKYFASGQTMTEASINAGFTRDIYVALGEQVEGATDGAWGVRIYVKPFINWIWGGCVLMALGGVLSLLDRRYRLKVKVREPEITLAASPPSPSGKAIPPSAKPQTAR